MKITTQLSFVEELIFRDRNKTYGAYQLRSLYGHHIKKALLFSICIFLFIVYTPVIKTWLFPPVEKEIITIWNPPPPPTDYIIRDIKTPSTGKGNNPPPPPKPKSTIPLYSIKDDDTIEIIPDSLDDKTNIGSGILDGFEMGIDHDLLGDIWDFDSDMPDVIITEQDNEEELHVYVEQMPVFGSGQNELLEYLASHIKYPVMASSNGIQGKVILQFVIDKTGKVTLPTVVRGIGGGCDEEALRVIRQMPDWTPGFQNGRPVHVKFTLPVQFTLH